MALPDSLTDRLYYTNRKDYTSKRGNVAYLDAKGLKRPFSMPIAQKAIALVIVIAAIFIGYTIVDRTIISTYRQAAAFESTIEANLSREASIETLPNIASLMPQDGETIKAAFMDAGVVVCDLTELNDSYDFLIARVPEGMSPEQVASMYAGGIGSLDAAQATQLLNGSWTLGTNWEYATMIVRYADFKTGDPQIAMQNAIAKEGFDTATITETGVDDSGNTFSTGTIETDGGLCIWKVSALPLDDIYSITNMPENACYVGVRLTYA